MDEVSLLGVDMFYRIHRRLVEIFQCEELFANKSILLVGDLLQLPPVKASYVFSTPKSQHFKSQHKNTPLWKSFQPIILSQNHRQNEARVWANTLNRIREGIVTEEDEALLRTRITVNAHLEHDAMHVFYTNAEVADHNNKMLNKLSGELIEVNAIKSGPRGYKPKIQSHGTIDDTQMMNKFTFKIGSRVKLTSNINTCDELVNGAFGTVLGVERNISGHVEYIIVAFDDDSCGHQQKDKFFSISQKYKSQNGTPITRHELEHIPKSFRGCKHAMRCKIVQFPLKLSWASTAHSMQGVTVKKGSKLVVHWHKRFTDGMAYVMLGRCESFEDVLIAGNFDICKIKANFEALQESQRLAKIYEEDMKSRNSLEGCLKISFLNVRSLMGKTEDVKQSTALLSSNIIGLAETWMHSKDLVDLPGYQGIFDNAGRGKGLAAFCKGRCTSFNCSFDGASIIKIIHQHLHVVFLYISKGADWIELKKSLIDVVDFECPTIIIGDVNWHWNKDSTHPMKLYLETRGMHQLIKRPTHDQGHCLDHVYVNIPVLKMAPIANTQAVYFSDHDLISLSFPNCKSE